MEERVKRVPGWSLSGSGFLFMRIISFAKLGGEGEGLIY